MAKLTAIDETNREHHFHLTPEDKCYFMFEYTSGKDYKFSPTNGLISNLKKKPSERNRPSYYYKGKAIRECSNHFRDALDPNWLAYATLVPIPCSKAADHPDFDDRIEQICCGIRPNPPLDVRSLVRQRTSTEAFHTGTRMRPEELVELYEIDEARVQPVPRAIGIVDDVMTAGTHYRAMHTVLSQRFPNVPITGLFIARRVLPPTVDFAAWFEELN